MDAEGLVKMFRYNIPGGRYGGYPKKKMERLNPWLKQAEPPIIQKKEWKFKTYKQNLKYIRLLYAR